MSSWSPRQLITFLDRVEPTLDLMSHFDLLDIGRDADASTVRSAFHRMASQLHPDLYRLHISPEDHERLTRIYGRIADAYLVLRDPESRGDYELEQTRRPDVEGTPALDAVLPPRARRLYRRAIAALRRGDRTSAILELRMALASAPESALLRNALDDALENRG